MNLDGENCDAELEMECRSVLKKSNVTKKRAAMVSEQLKQGKKISKLEQHSPNTVTRNEVFGLQQEKHKIKTSEEIHSAAATIDVLAQILQQREKNRQRRHKERLQMYQFYQVKFLHQREKSAKIHQQMMEKIMQRLLDTPSNV